MNLGIISRDILSVLLCLFCTFQFSIENEVTASEKEVNNGIKDVIDFKVSVKRLKREIRTIPNEDLSPLEGRTHRASEPLDPNDPEPAAHPFSEFDTFNTIFNPSVEDESKDDDPEVHDRPDERPATPNNITGKDALQAANRGDPVADGDNAEEGEIREESDEHEDDANANDQDNNGNNDEDEKAHKYAAQYPYPSSQYPSGRDETPRRFYPGDLDQPPYQAGVVEPYAQRPHSESRNQNRQYPDGSRVYSQQTFQVDQAGNANRGYPSGGSGRSVDNSRGRQVTRGAPYNGEVFVDNQGHYIDAQGRHLDSTGRYYDTSGRFQDALVTRTVSYNNRGPGYSHSPQRMGSPNGQYSEGGVPSRSRGSPLDSYGGNQFYQTESGSYPVSYDPVVSQISDDPNCPDMNVQVTINGLPCNNAVVQLGSFVCYNYERVSTECCQRCLQVKRREHEGCEYGDRSNQCRNIQPFNCYDDRNRQLCCDRCRQFLEQRGQGGSIFHSREQLISRCSFDDITPRCSNVRERPYLCYLPENQRLCCGICPRLANNDEPGCKWGDQSPEVCEPFDGNRRLQLNCYIDAVKDICCSTCKSLRERMPERIPGCEYGDGPTLFRTGRGLLNCGEFIRHYGSNQCTNPQTATKCCYTCHRYANLRRSK